MTPSGPLAYVQDLAAALPPAVNPAELVAAASSLQEAIDNPAGIARDEWNMRVRELEEQREALKEQLAEALLAAIPIGEVRALLARFDWSRPEGFSARPELGPLVVELNAPPLVARFPGDPTVVAVIGPQLPDTVSGRLDAGPMRGGGTLQVLGAEGLRGVLGITLGSLDVTAISSLRRARDGTPSFLAILGVGFNPGIQLGFGFTLGRVGGLVGVNRRVDTDALAARLRSGTAADVLFASDPLADAVRLLAAVDELFAPNPGTHLVGPTLRISWLQVGGGGLFDVDVGVILELPGPSRIVIAGSARAEVSGPPSLLRLRLDVLGVLDFAQQTIAFDATLVDSHALGVFVMSGDAAFRLGYGDRPYTVLSIGGFYPGFRPEPANLPPLARVALALEIPVPVLTLRAEGYFAVTSNTLQLGARIEVSISAGISAVGSFGLDALIQFTPFHFRADFFAGFRVEVAGFAFGGVRLDGTIDGPGPVVISGRLTIETFLFDISWNETFTLGSGSQASSPPLRLLDELLQELRAENLRARGGPDPVVVVRPRPGSGIALVSPVGELAWSQKRAPLGVPIDRVRGVPLGSTQSVAVVSPRDDEVRELFSPGSFCTLTQSEALNRPAFEELAAGVVVAPPAAEAPPPGRVPQPTGMKAYRKVRGEPLNALGDGQFVLAPLLLLDLLGDRFRPATVTDTSPVVAILADQWTAAGEGFSSATAAHQHARLAGGVALAAADADRPVDPMAF